MLRWKRNFANLARNYSFLREISEKNQAICGAVVKADAYNFGVIETVSLLYQMECRHFFCADAQEGLEILDGLKESDLDLTEIQRNEIKIYLLNGITPGEEAIISKNGLIPVLNSINQIQIYQNYLQKHELKADVAIQIDTGLNRSGLNDDEVKFLGNNFHSLTSAFLINFYQSHLADTAPPLLRSGEQLKNLNKALKLLPKYPISFLNSIGMIHLDQSFFFDLTRPGLALYGGLPENFVTSSLSAKLLDSKKIPAGSSIGYGSHYHTQKEITIGTVAIGYKDGYPKSLASLHPNRKKGYMLLNNHRAYIIGNISMDLTTVDLTSIPESLYRNQDCFFEIFGENLSIWQLAKLAGISTHELLISLPRKKRD